MQGFSSCIGTIDLPMPDTSRLIGVQTLVENPAYGHFGVCFSPDFCAEMHEHQSTRVLKSKIDTLSSSKQARGGGQDPKIKKKR